MNSGISGDASQGLQAGLHRVQCYHRRSMGHWMRLAPAASCRSLPVRTVMMLVCHRDQQCQRKACQAALTVAVQSSNKPYLCSAALLKPPKRGGLPFLAVQTGFCWGIAKEGGPCSARLPGAVPAHTDARRGSTQPLHLARRPAVRAHPCT